GALVLVDLGHELRRRGDRYAGQNLREIAACRELVLRVRIRVDETDRHGVDRVFADHARHRIEVFGAHWREHRSVAHHALAHFEPEPTFHQWLWFAVADVVEARRAEAPDLEHVAEAPGRDERDAHAPSLDDRVGG